jgi:hypothetical protein
MGASLPTRKKKACFNAVETSHFTFSLNHKFKVTSAPSAGKAVLTVFWDCQGAMLAHLQNRGENVNSAFHCKVQANWQEG